MPLKKKHSCQNKNYSHDLLLIHKDILLSQKSKEGKALIFASKLVKDEFQDRYRFNEDKDLETKQDKVFQATSVPVPLSKRKDLRETWQRPGRDLRETCQKPEMDLRELSERPKRDLRETREELMKDILRDPKRDLSPNDED